jgi:hypothetical protein
MTKATYLRPCSNTSQSNLINKPSQNEAFWVPNTAKAAPRGNLEKKQELV